MPAPRTGVNSSTPSAEELLRAFHPWLTVWLRFWVLASHRIRFRFLATYRLHFRASGLIKRLVIYVCGNVLGHCRIPYGAALGGDQLSPVAADSTQIRQSSSSCSV
jgi:hypothetical protein